MRLAAALHLQPVNVDERAKRPQSHVAAGQPKGCSLAPSLVLVQRLSVFTSKAATNSREMQGLMFNRLRSGVGCAIFLVFKLRAVLLQGELGTPCNPVVDLCTASIIVVMHHTLNVLQHFTAVCRIANLPSESDAGHEVIDNNGSFETVRSEASANQSMHVAPLPMNLVCLK